METISTLWKPKYLMIIKGTYFKNKELQTVIYYIKCKNICYTNPRYILSMGSYYFYFHTTKLTQTTSSFYLSYFIVCSLGRYGYNCDQSCEGCLSDSCDKEHGVCTDASRCKHGWQHAHPWKCDKGMQIKSYIFSFMHSKKLFIKVLTFKW